MFEGAFELLFLALIGVILLGPEQTAKMAYKLGRWVREVQKMSRDFTSELTREADLEDIRKETKKIEQTIVSTGKEFNADEMKNYHTNIVHPEDHIAPTEPPPSLPAETHEHTSA